MSTEPSERVAALSAVEARDSAIRSILIVKPSSLGDVVHTLPAVALVKKHWPAARLRWLINPEWASLLAGNPYVDEIVLFPRGEFRGLRGWRKIPAWAKHVSAHRAELVLDFQGLLRSALVARLCRATGGRSIGLSDAREGARWFYDERVNVSEITHAVDRYLAVVAALGIATPPSLEWPLPAGDAVPGVPESGFVLFHPFSRGTGKSLGVEEVREFCAALAPQHVVIAGRSEAQIVPTGNTHNLLNRTTLPELIWLLRRAAFVVSVDSGPMHIAAAITERLVGIHAWSDPAKVGPYQPNAWVWKNRVLSRVRHLADPSTHLLCTDIRELAIFVAQQTR